MKNFAFTMAEILISLTIVGIVAAITLPALQGNIQEKTWATQKKALYSRMTQAVAMMPAMNGYGFKDMTNINSKATLEFISEFSKVLKINNVCDNDHLKDCGINVNTSNKLQVSDPSGTQTNLDVTNLQKYLDANSITVPSVGEGLSRTDLNVQKAGFETINGESVLVIYNPYCGTATHDINTANENLIYNKVCANMIYDLNGTNGPNTFGRDVGIVTVLYSADSVVVSPIPSKATVTEEKDYTSAVSACRTVDEESRLPNLEEAIAMEYNNKLFKASGNGRESMFWTNSNVDSDIAWVSLSAGKYKSLAKTGRAYVKCVKR